MDNIGTVAEKGFEQLFTEKQYKQLFANGIDGHKDQIPVAYIVQPELEYQWLITELYEHQPEIGYGLFYLNTGKPEVGLFDLNFITELNSSEKKVFNYPAFYTVERLSLFKAVAEECGYIVTREDLNKELFDKYKKLIY